MRVAFFAIFAVLVLSWRHGDPGRGRGRGRGGGNGGRPGNKCKSEKTELQKIRKDLIHELNDCRRADGYVPEADINDILEFIDDITPSCGQNGWFSAFESQINRRIDELLDCRPDDDDDEPLFCGEAGSCQPAGTNCVPGVPSSDCLAPKVCCLPQQS